MAHLDWAVKASLIMYVAGAPGGRLAVEGVGGSGADFYFPLDTERVPAPTADDTWFAFTGIVRFIGHFGSYVGQIAQAEVDQRGDDWELSIVDEGAEERTAAFRLAGAPVREGTRLSWDVVELTADGAKLFGGSYPEGTRFEPLAIELGETPAA
ncbi:HtaA domain-containing protein [Antribacter gilvus]|uniref:HtaA domain-containing protein n=1 Tax=Antribacter gilvus TaxID=2304675 RepID=UPI000F797F70|nr:HtaA domain-containing protein [Antribacter gilvus]